jgi:hypothetical protein
MRSSGMLLISMLGALVLPAGVSAQPIATDAPANGFVFAVHRGVSPEHVSAPEPLRITNTVDPTGSWISASSEPWLVLSPASGVAPATATISLNTAQAAVLTRGFYVGHIFIAPTSAPQNPRIIQVVLSITDTTSITQSPIGFLETPLHNATDLNGAVPVTGWAADDVGVSRVSIFRSSVGGEPAGEIFLGDGTRVRGARPDVRNAISAPGVSSAGWGLMVLSNVLPNAGAGTFTLSAYADDVEGHRTLLGRTTVTFNNPGSIFPFGTIDVPGQGATVAGTVNSQGWILAAPGGTIPFDGSTIRLLIDGVEQTAVAQYGFARPDVAALFPFPTYSNANGPAAQLTFDSRLFPDGLHTIVWVASDDRAAVQGIGSRFFNIQNGSASQAITETALEARGAAELRALPQSPALIWDRAGVAQSTWSLRFTGASGTNEIRQARGELVEVALDSWWWSQGCGRYTGYLVTGDVAGPLPTGASFDAAQGVFRWLPPMEFSGSYEFVFVRPACNGLEERISLHITIQ